MKKDASRFSPKGVLFHRTFFTAPFILHRAVLVILIMMYARKVMPAFLFIPSEIVLLCAFISWLKSREFCVGD